MPLQSAHVFASHIGHTGKTTLCFQMSCYYARQHPDTRVLVMDLAEEGDLTKRLLGGVDAASGKVADIFGGIFSLLNDAKKESEGMRSWLWSGTVDITKHAVQISQHNPEVPSNLFLVSSGAWPRDDPDMDVEQRKRLVEKIKESLDKSDATWKLFCDTDGDRRPSLFTKIAYGLCGQAIVPLHLNKADLDRTETMLGVMQELRERNEISTQVLLIVWNFVDANKNEPCEHNGYQLPFTPTLVNIDVLDNCNQRVTKLRTDLPGLFVHEQAADLDFVKDSTIVCRRLADNVLKPSEELGRPFVSMVDELERRKVKTLKFQSGSTSYSAAEAVISGADAQLQAISAKFEAMSLTAPGPSGGYH